MAYGPRYEPTNPRQRLERPRSPYNGIRALQAMRTLIRWGRDP
jgi:hypothetical protein